MGVRGVGVWCMWVVAVRVVRVVAVRVVRVVRVVIVEEQPATLISGGVPCRDCYAMGTNRLGPISLTDDAGRRMVEWAIE